MDDRTGRVAGAHRRFEILVVCTANLCRSPMLEALVRDRLAESPAAWTVGSAGTHAADGRPVHPLTAQALFEHGIALPDTWRSRRLDAAIVERSDLVLTATREHRSDVVRTDPRASGRTFTARQFLRLLTTPDAAAPDSDHVVAHAGDALLDAALAARGLGSAGPAAADDIPDPVGRPYPVFRALAAELADELRVLSDPPGSSHRVLTPAPPAPEPVRQGPWWASLRSST